MPRGFTDQEQARIRQALMGRGKVLFETYGLRKTTVDELAAAAGISKGAFYRFFDSKEALFFAILLQAEAEVKQQLLHIEATDDATGYDRFRAMLTNVLALWCSNPLFARAGNEEYAQLVRTLPPETVQAHLDDDAAFAQTFVTHWRQAGVPISARPDVVSELIRALFFVSLHEAEFRAGVFPQVMDALIAGVTSYVVQEHEGQS